MRDLPVDVIAELADIGAGLFGLDTARPDYTEERRRLEARLNILAMAVAHERRKGANSERTR